jgi:hypothetical protein
MKMMTNMTLSDSMIISTVIAVIVYAILVWLGSLIGLLWWQSVLIILAVLIACAIFMYVITIKHV